MNQSKEAPPSDAASGKLTWVLKHHISNQENRKATRTALNIGITEGDDVTPIAA